MVWQLVAEVVKSVDLLSTTTTMQETAPGPQEFNSGDKEKALLEEEKQETADTIWG